ncbi:MAG: hypothetical protein EA381_01095 [Planctomycetaceae bacterium]|nr:MAG: hypothetical protein EA381_01095 [Planctomycetaceae bacterium]
MPTPQTVIDQSNALVLLNSSRQRPRVYLRATSWSLGALGRTATRKASTVAFVTGAWVRNFSSVAEARSVIEGRRSHYNHPRPHSSLRGLTPSKFASQCAASDRAASPLQQHIAKFVSQPVLSQPVLSQPWTK